MPFKKGKSGNPKGRPPQQQFPELKKMLNRYGPKVLSTVLKLALSGDIQACKLILDRVYPTIKSQTLPVYVESDPGMENQADEIIKETLRGNIAPDVAVMLINTIIDLAKIQNVDAMKENYIIDIDEYKRIRDEMITDDQC